ncbi:MAG TPA: serine hydrolase [Pyrinomonadaceae bacterium]|nr:serine hydrolase [Pyrinomonadaceae bacterium]
MYINNFFYSRFLFTSLLCFSLFLSSQPQSVSAQVSQTQGAEQQKQSRSLTPPTDQELIAKVDEYMAAATKVLGFGGTILIARDGKPIISKGYGMANIEHSVPNSPQTVFRLGSITKQFTAMAIMMLQERGRLKIDDPICNYLKDCPAAWQTVNIRQLLTHTSGIPSYTAFPEYVKFSVQPMTPEVMLSMLRDKPLEFSPGEKFAYNNSGYYLLGVIIERVSGKSYADFLKENIFIPLGMTQTGYDNPLDVVKNRAAGYARRAGTVLNASYVDMSVPFAAGALYSTVEDLLRWDQALYTEKLVPKKTLDEIFTPVKNGYGFGWGIGKRFGRDMISHGGNINGFATQIMRFPSDKITVIVLSNFEGAPAGRIAGELSAIVFGAPYEIPKERKEISVEPKALEKYVGEYQLQQPKAILTISIENGKLVAQIANQPKLLLAAEAEDRFFSKDINLLINFIKNDQGNIGGLVLQIDGSRLPAQKIK